ncbi:MAG: hypothetical protein AAF598_09470 [Bacteroidota bacterium]
MKNVLLSVALILASFQLSAQQENFFLVIGADTFYVDHGSLIPYQSGKCELEIQFFEKQTKFYDDRFFSFEYDKAYSVAKTKVEEGVEQVMIMTADGNGFLIQSYDGLDPSMLTNFMIGELTKESIKYGYEEVRTQATRNLASGERLNGMVSKLAYNNDEEIYSVYGYGKKDQGVLIVTLQNNLSPDLGEALIESMWKSLKLKF